MIRRMLLNVLCICLLLTAMGCNSKQEEQTESDDIPAAGYDTETGSEVLSEDDRESADVTESNREEQTESDIPASGSNTETGKEVLSEDDGESADVSENGQEERAELPQCYAELIAAATACLEGNAEEDGNYDFSCIIYGFGPNMDEDDKANFGYLIEDIDGNGTEELIFGENGPGAWDGVIYDLYTIHDGELVHVFDGWDRNRYYLCENNGMFANEGSSSAFTGGNAYYVFEGTELHLVEAVLFNNQESPDNPWFYSTTTDDYYDLENAEPINEDQARAIMKGYVYAHTKFIPFVEE